MKEARAAREASSFEFGGKYRPAPRDRCDSRETVAILDDAATLRRCLWFWRLGSDTTEFVYTLEQFRDNEWRRMVRIDCKHGTCHVHDPDEAPAGKVLMELNGPEDINPAMKLALQELAVIQARLLSD